LLVPALLLLGCGKEGTPLAPVSGRELTVNKPLSNGTVRWQARGTTRPAPGRKGVIAPVPLHPVIEVKVKPGDRVKKGQVLVRLDDDEPQAEVRAKKAAVAELRATVARLKAQPREEERAEARSALETVKVSVLETRKQLKRFTSLYTQGAFTLSKFDETQATLLKLEAEERAAAARLQQVLKRPWKLEIAEAEAKLAGAQAAAAVSAAELEHYTVTAPIDGVVSWLDVHPGTVSRPGTSVWGEILDLSEIDVQCDLSPGQAGRVRLGEGAVVRQGEGAEAMRGRVAFVGVAADPRSGRVPVWVRVANPGGRLRCYTEVVVSFGDQ
jgi:HlyD family secretion protein